ncbi:MAG: glyoxalase superfamily protein [Arenicella sp.]
MNFSEVTPIIRIFDEVKAKEFYIEYLGFSVDWEHRFEAGLPLYLQISRGDCVLHLTEHHGDCCPGAAMRIKTTGLKEFHEELHQKNPNYGPGIERMPWGTDDLSVKDPFGNRLTFCSEIST